MARKDEPQNASSKGRKTATGKVKNQKQQVVRSLAGETSTKTTTRKGRAQAAIDAQPQAAPLFRVIDLTLGCEASTVEDFKYERRTSAEYLLRRSSEVREIFASRPAEFTKLVLALAYARVHWVEAKLCGLKTVHVIGRLPVTIEDLKSWWFSFQVEGVWFKIAVHDTYRREYELVVDDGPSPPDMPEPKVSRQQTTPPPKHVGPRPRGERSRNDVKGIRAVADRPRTNVASPKKGKRQKAAKRIAIALFNRGVRELDGLRDRFDHSFAELSRSVRPRLLRSVIGMRHVGGSALRAMCDVRAQFVQVADESAALVRSIHKALTKSRAEVTKVGSEARLESRFVGQNTGFNLVLNSWIRNDTLPIDWSQWLFGVDWSLNLFGVPEEEQAFT